MKSFLMGFAIGLGGGLLLAPVAGSETRKKVMDKIGKATDRVSSSSKPIVDAVRSQVEHIAEGEYTSASLQPNVTEIESTQVLDILNSASKTRLMKVSGIGEATARRITDGRPYADVDSVIDGHILSQELLDKVKKLAIEEAEGEVA